MPLISSARPAATAIQGQRQRHHHARRRPRGALWWWLCGLALNVAFTLLGPVSSAHAHLIDEVAESILIDVQSGDRQTFAVTFVLHAERLAAYFHQAEQLGMAPERSDLGFAKRLALGFRFGDCPLTPASDGPVAKPVRDGRFRAFRLVARCPAPREQVLLERVDYKRRKTRTTLYLTVRIGDAPTRRMLLPPRLSGLSVPLTGGVPTPAPASAREAKGRAAGPGSPASGAKPAETALAKRNSASADAQRTPSPADRVDVAKLPAPSQALPPWRRALARPPWPILQIWAEAGTRHLAGGADHLLFLLALTLAALRYRRLVAGAFAFSVGHMVTMAAAIALAWPPIAAIEVAIGLSIVWSAWHARRPGLDRGAIAGAFVFGLIHGTAFGTELQHLVGGSEGLLWPVLSFGVGLDVAQLLWISVAFALWTPVRRRVREQTLRDANAPQAGRQDTPKDQPKITPPPKLQQLAAAALMMAGVAFALRAIWHALAP